LSFSSVAIVVACIALFAFGIVLTLRWTSGDRVVAPQADDPRPRIVALRMLWWFALIAAAGCTSGLLIIGAGGRLAMRALAATSGRAQGAETEAGEIVGDITLGGTLGFFLFVGLLGGAFCALLYAVLQRWLPRTPLRGVMFGALLLVLVSTRIEPLRTNNEDFDIVGPAWLAILLFGLLALLQGAAVASLTSRWGATLPLLTEWRAVPRYLPLVPFLLLGSTVIVLVIVTGAAVAAVRFGLSRDGPRQVWNIAGGIAVILLVLVSLPGFVSSLTDIAQRG
jgi:hypothetical protein